MNSILRDELYRSTRAIRAVDHQAAMMINRIMQDKADDATETDRSEGRVPFLLVVVDTSRRSFSIEGPMTDIRAWRLAVLSVRILGTRLACFVKAGQSRFDKALLAQEIHRCFDYRQVSSGSIVRPSRQRLPSAALG